MITPGCCSSPEPGSQVRCASNAPGAFPDSPSAPRNFMVPHHSGQKAWSETRYESWTFGYVARPKPSPKVLKPS